MRSPSSSCQEKQNRHPVFAVASPAVREALRRLIPPRIRCQSNQEESPDAESGKVHESYQGYGIGSTAEFDHSTHLSGDLRKSLDVAGRNVSNGEYAICSSERKSDR